MATFSLGCGDNTIYNGNRLEKDVNLDIRLPIISFDNFVLGSGVVLPFRKGIFDIAYAYNVLEHISDLSVAVKELERCSKHIKIRQDKVYRLGNYTTDEHKWITCNKRYIPYPSIIRKILTRCLQSKFMFFLRFLCNKLVKYHC